MTTLEVLLQAVATSPSDTAPRLILADWLEEHGSPLAVLWRNADVCRTATFASNSRISASAVYTIPRLMQDGDGSGLGHERAGPTGDGFQTLRLVHDGDGRGDGNTDINGNGYGGGPGILISDHLKDDFPETTRWLRLGTAQ